MEFDYIIVGSGAAGSVLADRLSRDPGNTVLVVEAGGSDRSPLHLVPKGFYFTMGNPRYAKGFTTNPYGPLDSVDTWFRGRVVGGSTTINGLIWNRGWKDDFDDLEADNPGWGWDTFLDAYKSIEKFAHGDPAIHGRSGPVSVEVAGAPEPLAEAIIDSGTHLGMERVADVNGSDRPRIGYSQSATRSGTRVSAARAFLRPAVKRDNVTLLTRAEVGEVLFEGNRAVGVRVRRRGEQSDYRAKREVLVCGGALESPLLLERSGIGAGRVLKGAGVEQRVESPHVGERMSEHRGLRFQYRVTGAKGYNQLVNSTYKQMFTGAKYLLRREGIISQGSASVLAYFKAHDEAQRPDALGFFNPISTANSNMHNKKLQVEAEPGVMIAVYPLRPTSQGSIHITGRTPEDPASIDPQYLTTDHDQQMIMAMGRKTRELFASSPISSFLREELVPGTSVSSDEDFVHNALTAGASGYHTLGTCAMGSRDDDVVDADLRVRGVEGLRVVDASVFPHQPSGNTSAPTQALAWHAASLILRDA